MFWSQPKGVVGLDIGSSAIKLIELKDQVDKAKLYAPAAGMVVYAREEGHEPTVWERFRDAYDPGSRKLTRDIVAVLSWIKSRWPADVRAKHDQINARAP